MLRCVVKNKLAINPILESIVEHMSVKLPMSCLNENYYLILYTQPTFYSLIVHHSACMIHCDVYVI